MSLENLSLIGRKTYKYNDNIIINIPTLQQVRGENDSEESSFWSDVNLFVQTPSDLISELDSMGIDFEQVSDYELFTLLFIMRKKTESIHNSILFKNFSFWDLEIINMEGNTVFVDDNGKVIMDETVYNDIAQIISTFTGHKRTPKKKFGNAFAKKKRIEQDYKQKEKMRNGKKERSNFLDGIILRLVCNANFPYNFETIQGVTIYDLIYSLKQIEKDIEVTDLMQTRLVGNDLSKVPRDYLSRFVL